MLFCFYWFSLEKDIELILKNFWPHRSKAKGFSIQNLARRYRLKISSTDLKSDEITNQLGDDTNLISIKEEPKKLMIDVQSVKRNHWANRDFSEYKEVA